MVDVTISDLSSEFLLLPLGDAFIQYPDFSSAYEVLKKHTQGFSSFTAESIDGALIENSRVLCILRAILGMTPPEWAELARVEYGSDITQNAARTLDRRCRERTDYVFTMERRKSSGNGERLKSLQRIHALTRVAIRYILEGAPEEVEGMVHRLAKFDTYKGLDSLQYASKENVPYAVLLYERYLGRPFAGHRDAVSELVGAVMENAVESTLRDAGVTFRKTGRAEKIPGFGQAPDFCIPDELSPVVVIEAKITSDDGTARAKVARIKALETQRNRHVAEGRPHYEVVACIDGRGFRERREDMRQMLLRLDGKVFTTASLTHLLTHTNIKKLVTVRTPRKR
jgi:hypothetical protein